MIFGYNQKTIKGFDFGYHYEIRKDVSLGFNICMGRDITIGLHFLCFHISLRASPNEVR